MPTVRARVIAIVVGAGLVLGATIPAAAARQGRATPEPSPAACEAFADYFQIEFLIAFASAFASLSDSKDAAASATQIRDTLHLILSPKLEQVARILARGTDSPLRALFTQHAEAFGAGVDLLEGVGLTKRQVRALSKLDLKPDTDLQAVVGDVNLNKKKLNAAAATFHDAAKAVDLNRATSKQKQAFRAAGIVCGVFPDGDLDCEQVVTPDEAAALLGTPATAKNEDGTCVYTPRTPVKGDDTELAVDMYKSALAFDRLAVSAQNQTVPGVGDAAVALDGFASFSNTKSCGRTFITKQGERTVVVASCAGTSAPSVEALAAVASNVLTRTG